MLISWNWLNRHVDLSGLDAREVGEAFTLKVAELEGVHEIGAGLEGARTALIEAVAPVEGSDKLSHVTVRDGQRTQTVVCGAPNVRDAVGRIGVLVPAGATLPDGTKIERATIRGVESNGMLASESELGLSEEHEGILLLDGDIAHGQALTDAVPVHDFVFEVDNKAITHRPDLWGHYGIAREVALLVDRPLKPLAPEVDFPKEGRVLVTVADPALCPRYTSAYFTGVQIAPSPAWLQCLLRATGVRPISNVVDLTNFVMMDVGNPMHAFDARQVAHHTIIVRRANEDEVITTLDGQERRCQRDDLLICDARRPVALAGIMGGENSEIKDDTTEVILEAANFDAQTIRRTSVRMGLRTESSARFEKALDPEAARTAALLFSRMMVDLIEGCRVVSRLVDEYSPLPTPPRIPLSPASVSERLGVPVTIGDIRRVLIKLGFEVQDRSSGDLSVGVPSWRATRDVAIPADLIEEIGRVHGYQNIPPQSPLVAVHKPALMPAKAQARAARRYLTEACGMHEALSYGFTWRPVLQRLGAEVGGRLELAHALSADMDRMRRSMIPNLLKFAEENGRFFDGYSLYEIGRVFEPVPGELPIQDRHVAAVVVDKVKSDADGEARFRSVKGMVEGLLGATRARSATFRRPTQAEIGFRKTWIHPQRAAAVLVGDEVIGLVSLLHPRAALALDMRGATSLLELNLDACLRAGARPARYTPLPRFPAIGFDVSFEVDEAVTAGALEQAIRDGLDTPWLQGAQLFGNYHLPDGKKSVSFHLTFRAVERSLKDKEVHKRVKSMVKHVGATMGATLRGG